MRAERRGEFARIRGLVAGLPRGEGVVLGAGDDAAVLRPRPGHDLVVTTDAFVEGRHWVAGRTAPAVVGRRLAAANLSDLAAMAAAPRWAVIACAAPRGSDPRVARAIEHACARALAAQGASVVGGNLSATRGPAWWCVTLIGEVRRGAHWSRAGARPGDVLAVTGFPGRAAAVTSASHPPAALARAWGAPACRVRAALAMARAGGVRAAVDVSDGLAGDLAHVCAASGVGAVIDAASLPHDRMLERLARGDAARLSAWRFGASDDYELLLAVDPRRYARVAAAARAAGARLTAIGRFSGDAGVLLLRGASGREARLRPRGYDHFA